MRQSKIYTPTGIRERPLAIPSFNGIGIVFKDIYYDHQYSTHFAISPSRTPPQSFLHLLASPFFPPATLGKQEAFNRKKKCVLKMWHGEGPNTRSAVSLIQVLVSSILEHCDFRPIQSSGICLKAMSLAAAICFEASTRLLLKS